MGVLRVLHSFPNPKKGCIINLRAAAPAADPEDEGTVFLEVVSSFRGMVLWCFGGEQLNSYNFVY